MKLIGYMMRPLKNVDLNKDYNSLEILKDNFETFNNVNNDNNSWNSL